VLFRSPNQGRKGVTRGHYCERRISTDEILEGKHPYYQCFKLKNRLLSLNSYFLLTKLNEKIAKKAFFELQLFYKSIIKG
jgi:hypothetical protein